MWIIAIAWIYVVVLMAATEPTVVAGIMTFAFYCALPLSILFYITGAKRRQRRGPSPQSRRQVGTERESRADDMDDGGGDGD
jgi:membrane protein implicated in regulation of membrane protease activity